MSKYTIKIFCNNNISETDALLLNYEYAKDKIIEPNYKYTTRDIIESDGLIHSIESRIINNINPKCNLITAYVFDKDNNLLFVYLKNKTDNICRIYRREAFARFRDDNAHHFDRDEMYILNGISDDDESIRSDIIIGSLLFGISFLVYDAVYKQAENVLNTQCSTRSLGIIKPALSFLVPSFLLGGGLAGIIGALYDHFKEKNEQKKLTLRKE